MDNAKLIEILEAAKSYDDQAMRYFEKYSKAEEADLKQIYWTRSEEMSGICSGLLFAYNIITDKNIGLSDLRYELTMSH